MITPWSPSPHPIMTYSVLILWSDSHKYAILVHEYHWTVPAQSGEVTGSRVYHKPQTQPYNGTLRQCTSVEMTAMGTSTFAIRSAHCDERNVAVTSPSLSPTVITALRTDTEGFYTRKSRSRGGLHCRVKQMQRLSSYRPQSRRPEKLSVQCQQV